MDIKKLLLIITCGSEYVEKKLLVVKNCVQDQINLFNI